MIKPRVFGWSVGSIIAMLMLAGAFLAYWETHARGDQSQDDRILTLETGDRKIGQWQESMDVRIRNAEALQSWTVIVLSMIADRQGIKNLPPLPLLNQAPRVGEPLRMERDQGPETTLIPSAMAEEGMTP